MTADYTKVALRADERWESAPAQEGRALLDHELNLNLEASLRRDRHLARDAVGASGVREGSAAFQVGVTATGALDLTVEPGRMWVDGRSALAPAAFTYSAQDQIAALPSSGRVLVYLDAWDQHIQPAEDPSVIDPALAPVDTAARTRVGYRVRVVPTTATTCDAAWAGFNPAQVSTGALTVSRTGPAVAPDPCDPPGDARGLLPDSLLRIEVLDQGAAAGARFAWSYENGAAAVPVAGIAGDRISLQPSASVKFGTDLVEVSWLARRADRLNAGSLYSVVDVVPSAGGDELQLNRPVDAPAAAEGLVVRRWDGEVIGAEVERNASRDGRDLGVRFVAGSGTYRPGDWWGVRVREADGVEPLSTASPDATEHGYAALALVDLDARSVVGDCRPRFRSLTDLELGSACTVVARPGDSLQAAVDGLPAGGGEVCLAAGEFTVTAPVLIRNRDKVRIVGVGPATVVRATTGEAVLQFVDSDDVEVRDLAVAASSAGTAPAKVGLNGAVTFEGCRGVAVRSVHATVPDGPVRTQTCVTVRGRGNRRPERVTIADNRLLVGAWQVGVLVTDVTDVAIERNRVSLRPAPLDVGIVFPGRSMFAEQLAGMLRASSTAVATRRARAVGDARLRPIVEEWVRADRPVDTRDDVAFRRFVIRAASDPRATLGATALTALLAAAGELRAVGQGIVVAGSDAATVRITGNVVRGAVQGIHVAVSQAGTPTIESVDEVLVAQNTVHLRVPATFSRDRHAVFVGNAESAHVTDTRASAERTAEIDGVPPTAIDAVRLVGHFGPFIVVRGGSFSGFSVGVRADPLGLVPTQRVWSISDVMARGASAGAVAPPSFVRGLVAP